MTRGAGSSAAGRGPAALFVTGLYRSAPLGSLVEVRFRTVSGMGRRFHEVDRLGPVVETILALASRTDVYVGVLPRRQRGGGRADLAKAASVVWVDCDTSSSVAALHRFRPAPGMVVGSGSDQNCHAYWFLEESVELEEIERVNRRLAVTLGADGRCSDPARILRPAGSMNRKQSPPAAVRLLTRAENQRVAVAELEGFLLAEPRELRPRTTPRHLRSDTTDPLAAIAPRVYFERLTGQAVGRSGKACCPFHDDRTPSLHLYEDPGQGWYCFGCGRGGSIYDLAARGCGAWERAVASSWRCTASSSTRWACNPNTGPAATFRSGVGGDSDGRVSLSPMWLQPITYRGRLAACATRTRVFLSNELSRRPVGDPELTFVLLMCCYARDVMSGELPGRYSDDKARAYARAALIPEELLERRLADPARTARVLAVPVDELLHARSAREAMAG